MKDYTVTTLRVGMLPTSCHIITADQGCIVVDPGDEPERIDNALTGPLLAILLTHGHFDHIGGIAGLIEKHPAAEIIIHALDAPALLDPELNASRMIRRPFTAPAATRTVEEGDTVDIGGLTFTVLHTPGHTIGSVCYRLGNDLFSGDTLFHAGFGRTDLPTGSMAQMRASLQRLSEMTDIEHLYPGHEV